jgi:hypothetical protein
MEYNYARNITEGLFRKHSTLWQHKCKTPITVLEIWNAIFLQSWKVNLQITSGNSSFRILKLGVEKYCNSIVAKGEFIDTILQTGRARFIYIICKFTFQDWRNIAFHWEQKENPFRLWPIKTSKIFYVVYFSSLMTVERKLAGILVQTFNDSGRGDLSTYSTGWSLEPKNLGGLRPRCIIFLTLLLEFYTYAVITYCAF